MALWREIERIRKDPDEARHVAKGLLNYAVEPDALTDWEVDFLESLSALRNVEELTSRQAEKLVEIRDDVTRITSYRGMSIGFLIRNCYESRLDLGEDDERWIAEIFAENPASIRRKQISRLLRCARQAGVIESRAA